MAEIQNEVNNILTKWWVLFCYVLLGLFGKIGVDMIRGRKMTAGRFVASIILGIFVGTVTGVICFYRDLKAEAAFLVPIATSLSEKIMLAALSIDYKQTIGDIAAYWANRFKK